MIASIKQFFSEMIEPAVDQPGAAGRHALHIATAALLLEMMRVDASVTAEETAAVTASLQTQLGVDAAEVATLMALAATEARHATDYFQFTSLINKSFSAEQKTRVIEYLWQVAFADGQLDAHEQHFVRKIADLLYVPHADYIAAKQRARKRHSPQHAADPDS